MNLSDFKLKKIVLEVRYDPAYLLWDHCGKIWTDIKTIWPEIVHKSAQPNKTFFELGKNINFTVELEKAFIICYNKKVNDILEYQENFLNVVFTNLKIDSFKRIGYRVFYEKEFKSKEDDSNAFIELGLIKTPHKKCFNIDGKVIQPAYMIYWEDDDLGIRINLKAVSTKLDLEVPQEVSDEMESTHLKKNILMYDMDYFTKASIKQSQFKLTDWVSQVDHIMKRDSDIILGGGQ